MLRRTASADTNAGGGSEPRRRGALARALRWAGLAALVAIGAVAATVGLIWLRLGPMPLSRAESMSVTVLDRNDRLLRAYTAADGRWRLPVDVKEVDARYLAMLIAFEDKRFRSHRGVDPWGVGRAAWQLIGHQRIVSGGSTLTMQVARLLQGEHERTGAGKIRQALRALELERRLSKDAILRLYLRLAPFGGNLEGVRAVRSPISARSRSGCRWPRRRCWWRCRSRRRCAGPTATRRRRGARATACSIARWRPA